LVFSDKSAVPIWHSPCYQQPETESGMRGFSAPMSGRDCLKETVP
jgi:hypothetical protein